MIVSKAECQIDIQADSLFRIASEYHEAGEIENSIKCFKEVALNHKNYKFYGQCFYNVAYVYYETNNSDSAIVWFEKVRNSNLRDDEENANGGAFITFTNYKHQASAYLGNIEYRKGNYEKAMTYYKEAEKLYPFYTESGTDRMIVENHLVVCYSNCLEKLGKSSECLMLLFERLLAAEFSLNYATIVTRYEEVIDANFEKSKLLKEVEVMLNDCKQIDEKSFELAFRNKSYVIPSNLRAGETKKEFVDRVKKNACWKYLEN
jgi:tetratricopeptide (TPR) repeat protein